MKPLKRCCNGCDAPPRPPSKVLCAACLKALGQKIHTAKHNRVPYWTMPDWMKSYSDRIWNTSGNDIEEMVNDDTPVQVNAPRAVLAACVKSQVALLIRLREAGLLRDKP